MATGALPNVLEIDGSGSLVSNVSAHDANPKNFVSFVDLITDVAGRIRKRPGIGAVKGATRAGVTAMHEFTRIDPVTKVVTRWLMRATDQVIEYWTGAAWSVMTLPTFTTTATTTPTAGGLWVFESGKNRCFAVNGKDDMIVFDGTSWKLAGCDGPISPMGYTLSGTFDSTTGGAHNLGATQGSPNITKTGGSAWDGAGPTYFMNGKTIEINGARYTIQTVTGASAATLTENFKEVNYVGASYKIFYGVGTWNNPPKAGYAYFNPTTGHCSNIRSAGLTTRNITEVVEADRVGTTITWGAGNTIVYDPLAYANGFTKIVLFRTPKDSDILQAVARSVADINNSAFAGGTFFIETAASFADTGLDKFPAPETKLSKPPIGLTSIKFYIGRLWGTKDDKVYYSLQDGDVVGEYGVAEESWPSTQYVTVDQPRGLKLVGGAAGEDNLVVQTARGDFAIAGYDRRTIYAYPLGTPEGGSYHYGALGTAGTMIAFYGDKRLISLEGTDLGIEIQDKLDTIKDSLLPKARVHRFSWRSTDYLMLSVAKTSGSASNDYTYVRDVRRAKWYEWSVGFECFTTAHDTATNGLQLWATNAAGESFQLLVDNTWQDKAVNFAPSFVTSHARPFGEDVRVELKVINAYVSDGTLAWAGELLINEQAVGGGQAFSFKQTRGADQSAQGREIDWGVPLTVRSSGNAMQLKVNFPAANSDLVMEKLGALFAPRQDTQAVKP